MTFRIVVFKGSDAKPYIRVLSEMRVREFRNFPYLYAGNVEEDIIYTQGYADSPQGVLIIAFQDEIIVGICSGTPMTTSMSFLESWSQALRQDDMDLNACFYAGELIVEQPFRNQGLGRQLIKSLMQEAKLMNFSSLALATSIRPKNHPLRPQDYFDTDLLWTKHGYQKQAQTFLTVYPTLQPDGTVKEEENLLACWIKKTS